MDILLTALLLLIFLLVSNIISHYFPYIPTALVQVALGVIIVLVHAGASFNVDTKWFLLLFVAPLLYNDGRYFSNEKLWELRSPIFGNAIILVLLTTFGGGFFIHKLIPSIPLAAAFALAAILSPTDPVAVNGIAKRIHIPENILSLVHGESLINDASGLVAFKYAVAAVITGGFSIYSASLDFAYKFMVGAFLGILLIFLISILKYTFHKNGIGDVVFYTLLEILTPFIIFIITEEIFGASGVIAVVFAGVVHSVLSENLAVSIASEKLITENVWSVILFTLNGIVFLLLGMLLPGSFTNVVKDPAINTAMAVFYALATYMAIMIVRFLWSHLNSIYTYHFSKNNKPEKPSLRSSIILTITGVRGAVTMAGVLSIPLLLNNGGHFPERALIIFIAAGVVIISLLVATIFLPLLVKPVEDECDATCKNNMFNAKKNIIIAAIGAVKGEINEINESVAYELINELKMQLKKLEFEQNPLESDQYREDLKTMRLYALQMERDYINSCLKSGVIDENSVRDMKIMLDNREEALCKSTKTGALIVLSRSFRKWRRSVAFSKLKNNNTKKSVINEIRINALKAATDALYAKREEAPEYTSVINEVLIDYKGIMSRVASFENKVNVDLNELKIELQMKSLDAERCQMRSMYENGEISSSQMKELRIFINQTEGIALYEHIDY